MDARTSRFTDRLRLAVRARRAAPDRRSHFRPAPPQRGGAQPRPALRRAGREQGEREHQRPAARRVRPDRAGSPARQPARLLPDGGRSLRAFHGGAAGPLAGVHRPDRRGAAHAAARQPRGAEPPGAYESALSYMADAIGRAMLRWRAVPSRRLAAHGVGSVRRGVIVVGAPPGGVRGDAERLGREGCVARPEVPWTPPAGALPRVAPADTSTRAAVPARPGRAHPPSDAGRDRGSRSPEQSRHPARLGQRQDRRLGVRLRARRLASVDRRRRERRAPQDRREPGPQRGRAVGAHAQRDAQLPAARLRRPQRPRGRGAAPAARRELRPQRRHPGRGAPGPGRLLPVPGQPRPAPGPADHGGGGAHQPDRGGGAPAGRARHHRRRAPGPDRGEPGPARSPDDRRQRADHPRRAGAVARPAGQPPATTWTRARPSRRWRRWPTA